MIMYKQMGVDVGNKIKTLFVVEMYTVLWPFIFLDKLLVLLPSKSSNRVFRADKTTQWLTEANNSINMKGV
jgi:hypothetical protein